ncbi:MAG: endo-1,4-beta-xylanase [Fimbriimonadaceae bacterium]
MQARVEKSTREAKAGQIVWVGYYLRTSGVQDESAEGGGSAFLETPEPPYHGVPLEQARAAGQWKAIRTAAVLERDHAAGELVFTLHLGGIAQTVEIGGFEAFLLPASTHLGDLPFTRYDYPGREADAGWRVNANERIERYRKGDFRVVVTDDEGQSVSGATVRFEMTRHAFGFGSFIDWDIRGLDEDTETYKRCYQDLFSKATTPMYGTDWGWENEEARQRFLAQAEWLSEQGLPTRGHVLVWPSWRWLPERYRKLNEQGTDLRPIISESIVKRMDAVKAFRFTEWDVLNEPRVNRDLMDLYGDEIMADWFHQAKTNAPDAVLYVNDYGLLSGGGRDLTAIQAYHVVVRHLVERDAPLGGIGFQGHFGNVVTEPTRVFEVLDEFAVYGLPLQITEFDVNTLDQELQADYTRDFLTICFSHPAVVGVMKWGFWERSHWRPKAAMFRDDWTIKPNGLAYQALVKGEWWTDESAETNGEGLAEIRGFFGDYRVIVTHQGKRREVTASFSDGDILRLNLDEAPDLELTDNRGTVNALD